MGKDWNKITIYDKYENAEVGKIGYLDIEVSNLHANFGEIISIVLGVRNVTSKLTDKKLKIIRWYVTEEDINTARRAGKPIQDKRILEQFLKRLKKENIKLLIAHYGMGWRGLDVPFIRARAMKLGLDHLLPRYRTMRYGDTWKIFHQLIRIHSYRLGAIAEALEEKNIKTELTGEQWEMAKIGYAPAISYILRHNVKDVILLSKLHRRGEDFVPIPSSYM